ncbi:hypothetical protein [Halosimplex pelagicum]|uniref:Uncharacterized protein n=1 Tax=Halosimplex pelagicum TaxID=869886 RepID=A0A7D5PAH8_9EURY|nr:hypothetical protein [Halosimplex pelagicum]QLH84766.1 hypothetical protein HZS54_25340 [Halosimplex pelagicum]
MSRARTKAITIAFAVFVASASFVGGVGAQSSDSVTLTVTVVDEGGEPA